MSDCIFCKIIENKIPSPRIYEDEKFICIRDIQPHAKKHLLVIPKQHIASLDLAPTELMGPMYDVALKVARQEKLLPSGFRAVINTGEDGGQTVFHLHLHLLGGQTLRGNLA